MGKCWWSRDGYEKTLEVNGVGYRASKAGKKLTLNLGYSHPVEMEDPKKACSSICYRRHGWTQAW